MPASRNLYRTGATWGGLGLDVESLLSSVLAHPIARCAYGTFAVQTAFSRSCGWHVTALQVSMEISSGVGYSSRAGHSFGVLAAAGLPQAASCTPAQCCMALFMCHMGASILNRSALTRSRMQENTFPANFGLVVSWPAMLDGAHSAVLLRGYNGKGKGLVAHSSGAHKVLGTLESIFPGEQERSRQRSQNLQLLDLHAPFHSACLLNATSWCTIELQKVWPMVGVLPARLANTAMVTSSCTGATRRALLFALREVPSRSR